MSVDSRLKQRQNSTRVRGRKLLNDSQFCCFWPKMPWILMIWESRWHAAFRRKLKGQEQSDSPWTAQQPGILNSVKCSFLEYILLWDFIHFQAVSLFLFAWYYAPLPYCVLRQVRTLYLDVPVGPLEPRSINASRQLKMSVYFQVVRKWTHWILFPCFSPNLFSCIIKPFIFLKDKGGPCSLFLGRLWWL